MVRQNRSICMVRQVQGQNAVAVNIKNAKLKMEASSND